MFFPRSNPTSMGPTVGLAIALAAAGVAWGQDEEPPASPPGTPEEAVEAPPETERDRSAARDLATPAHGGRVYPAARPERSAPSTIPGIVLPDLSPPGGRLIAEGSLLPDRRGILAPVGDEDWAYVFDADAAGMSEPPMLMAPCRRLEEMVRLVESRSETVTFELDAQAYVYRGRNLLLPIRFETIGTEAAETTEEEERELTLEANRELLEDETLGETTVDQLLERLDRRAGRRLEGARSSAIAADTVERQDRVTEGAWVRARPGRLTRGGRGRWLFVPENDADEGTGVRGDEPLVLMPCLNLERLERLAARYGEGVRLTLSGPVFAYRSETVVHPTMFIIDPGGTGNLTPAR